METLLAILIAALAARGPVTPGERERISAVADDMWTETATSTLYCGPQAQEAASLALATVAVHESGLWAKVQDCSACYIGSQHCDRGFSVSIYQLHAGSRSWAGFTRTEICADNGLATRLALRILERHRGARDAAGVVRGYARGGRHAAAGEMATLYSAYLSKARINVVRRGTCLSAERIGL
jgi:hypothetical protein